MGRTAPGNSRLMQALPIAAVLVVMALALYAGRDQLTGAITGERLGRPKHNTPVGTPSPQPAARAAPGPFGEL